MRMLKAGTPEAAAFLSALRQRTRLPSPEVEGVVRAILEDIRSRGDAALFEYTEKLDGVRLDASRARVSQTEIQAARESLDPIVFAALALAAERIEAFHRRQHRESWFYHETGIGLLGQLVRPLSRVGLYVPGGSAAYPSTVLMGAIPARVAGVEEMVICTPAWEGRSVPAAVLVAAHLAGVQEIYRIGGAQAVAALAYGTESIRPVDKIVGPGNIYVATAKRLVFGVVGIDMVAGPSEVLIVADETVAAGWVAADLLAQAEHDPLAAAICVTPSFELGGSVQVEVENQLMALPRRSLAREALSAFGAVIVTGDLAEAMDVANTVAPEHLELFVADPWALIPRVRNAGALFLGPHTPEVAGDYLAGPNHVLPTAGSARFSSALGVYDFQKRTSIIDVSQAAAERLGRVAATLADAEGLPAHARAARMRYE